jgi:hypothetical protein
MTAQGTVTAVREYIADTNATYSASGSAVTVSGQVEPYDIRVYAVEFNPTLTTAPSAPTNVRIIR